MSSSLLPSSKYNVERSTRITGGEDQFAAMVLFYDATRERETDSPPTLLCRESRLEDTGAETCWYSRAIVGNANADAALPQRRCREADASAAARERIDGILRQHLDGPLEQDRIAIYRRGTTIVLDIDRDGIGEGWHASTEIGSDSIDKSRDVDRLALGLATNALESVRDPVEPFEIGTHVNGGRVRRR